MQVFNLFVLMNLNNQYLDTSHQHYYFQYIIYIINYRPCALIKMHFIRNIMSIGDKSENKARHIRRNDGNGCT